jgi:hypothetical protein
MLKVRSAEPREKTERMARVENFMVVIVVEVGRTV